VAFFSVESQASGLEGLAIARRVKLKNRRRKTPFPPQDFSGGSLAQTGKGLSMTETKKGGSGREQQVKRCIDEDERIQFMKRQGLTIPQIAGKLATDPRSVRKRLQLLRRASEER
jgi:hypothetical protein